MCTFTNSRDTGALEIVKAVTGAPDGFTDTFAFHVECTLADQTTLSYDPAVSYPTPGSFTMTDIPTGYRCVVTEPTVPSAPPDHEWVLAPSSITGSPATITKDVTASVTVTNELGSAAPELGSLVIKKNLADGGSGFAPTTTFSIHYDCGDGFVGDVDVAPSNASGATVGNLPVGSVCTVTENSPLPAPPTGYSWGTPVITGSPATILVVESVTVTVGNSLTRDTGSLVIKKTLSNTDAASVPASFTIHYNCGGVYAGDVSVAAAGQATVNNIPTGSICTVTEPSLTPITGYTWASPVVTGSPTAPITKGNTVEVTVANSITRDRGSLSILKTLSNPAGASVASQFSIHYNCGGSYAGDVLVTAGDASGATITGIPTGSTCTVSENPLPSPPYLYAWGAPSYSPSNQVTVTTKGQTVTVSVVNSIARDPGWCVKQPVQDVLNPSTGIYPGNKGPDVVVHVDLGQSVQLAVNGATDSNNDGFIIVAVSGQPGSQLGGSAKQKVAVAANYGTAKPFALIGCSVTLTGGGTDPAVWIKSTASSRNITVNSRTTNIFLMDLHGASSAAGVEADGANRYLRNEGNTGAINNVTGIKVLGDNNTVHNGAANGSTGDGVYVSGNGNLLTDTNSMSNKGNGFNVVGTANQLVRLNAGEKATPNGADGVHVVGNGNALSEITAYANALDGIDVAGATNTLSANVAGDGGKGNGQSGFRVAGAGNSLQTNTARANTGDGFTVTLGTSVSPNRLKSNQSNTGTSGSTLENKGAEYRLTGSVKNDGGGNAADTIVVPKTTSPTKCTALPATNATATFSVANACE